MKTKLNVLLAKTDHLAAPFKKLQEEYVKFFKTHGGSFTGEKKTYEPKTGTIDIPSERVNRLVITTWDEKEKYLREHSKEYIDALFSQERTNASGTAKAKLMVDNIPFGEFTSLELLRLKSLLEGATLKEMYETIPVRSENEAWKKSINESYTGRNIFETELRNSIVKTTIKENYILTDPNISKVESAKYTPQVSVKDSVLELGDSTYQKFSGEASAMERAMILARRTKLLVAVIEAMKTANEVEAIPSEMTADKLFGYLHTGKI